MPMTLTLEAIDLAKRRSSAVLYVEGVNCFPGARASSPAEPATYADFEVMHTELSADTFAFDARSPSAASGRGRPRSKKRPVISPIYGRLPALMNR